MLKQRLLTALFLIPLFIGIVFVLPSYLVASLFAIVVLQATWEWGRLINLPMRAERLLLVSGVLNVLWFGYLLSASSIAVNLLLGVAVLWWCLAAWWIRQFEAEHDIPYGRYLGRDVWAGMLTLVPAWLALVVLHANPALGPRYVVFLLVLIWVADSGAYFIGRRFGRHKLARLVSPGKTWEGAAGALLVSLLVAWIGVAALDVDDGVRLQFVVICIVTAMFSIVGDLFESLVKRRAGVKDSGTLLPGHGGVLDRIDSLTAAAPVFLFGLILTGNT